MSSTYKPINVTNSSTLLFFCLFFCVKDGQVSLHTSVLVIGKRVMMDHKEQHCHFTNKAHPLFPISLLNLHNKAMYLFNMFKILFYKQLTSHPDQESLAWRDRPRKPQLL